MPDPFADLRAADAPVDPSPEFAAGLRAPRAGTGPAERSDPSDRNQRGPTTDRDAIRRGSLSGRRRCRAIDWYVEIFGAREETYGRRADCTDDQQVPFAIHEAASDCDAERPPAHGRTAGDLAYLTLEVVDSARARAFCGAVFGWTFAPGRVADGWQVEDSVPMTGLSGGHGQAHGVPMWRVDDIERAVAEVRARGGSATDPEQQSYGLTSECRDDQGSRFYLVEL